MKNWLKIILIITLIFVSFGYTKTVLAAIDVTNVEIEEIKDNMATLKWRTNQDTKNVVYYGLDSNDLDRRQSYNTYSRRHQALLNNLEKNKTYYYKIISSNRAGESTELFTQNFSTRDMEDTRNPEILSSGVIQTTGNAVAIEWETSEETYADIYFGSVDEGMIHHRGDGSFITNHVYYVYHLTANTEYYLKIIAKDRAGNTDTESLHFYTYNKDEGMKMSIYDVEPLNSNSELISATKVDIKFRTNLATKTYLSLGPSSGRYYWTHYQQDKPTGTNHQINLTDLEPDTTYYYVISTYGGLYNLAARTSEFSFKTKPLPKVLGTKITADMDRDNDGLSDAYEKDLGTDPTNADTDGDGYPDKLEIDNGYDPKGPGRLNVKKYYNKARIANHLEQKYARDLKIGLERELNQLDLNAQGWFTVVNAYIYGDYPVEAIVKAIEHGGKTVHPTIGWTAWKNSPDYTNYINK
ncbi:fibronectin type III domain-containing protein [bacterium]|nr:fibronectin type III domain-containing protein [bacterium]